MKKILIVIMILSLMIVGCGSDKDKEQDAAEKVAEKAAEKIIEAEFGDDVEIETKDGATTITTDEGHELTVANDMETGVPIPEGYPHSLLPVYSDEFIVMASVNQDGSFSISGYTKDELSKVVEFYEDELSEGNELMKQISEDDYLNMGEFNGVTYTVSVVPADDDMEYSTVFTLVVFPVIGDTEVVDESDDAEDDAEDEQSDGDGIERDIVIPDDIVWPEDYPEDILPIYPTGNTEAAGVDDMGSQITVGIMTEDNIKGVVEFYDDLLQDALDYSKINMEPTYMISGTIDDINIQVMVMENGEHTGEDLRFKTVIAITY